MNTKQFLKRTRSTVSRGLPSSRMLHSLEIRRAHILARRDWLDAKLEAAQKANAGNDRAIFVRALSAIHRFAAKFRPWLQKTAA